MPHRTTIVNILTSDYTVVCSDHYKQMRRRLNWRQVSHTRDECEICPLERSCGGPAFCLDSHCQFCNHL